MHNHTSGEIEQHVIPFQNIMIAILIIHYLKIMFFLIKIKIHGIPGSVWQFDNYNPD
jgi:hypothetical protein